MLYPFPRIFLQIGNLNGPNNETAHWANQRHAKRDVPTSSGAEEILFAHSHHTHHFTSVYPTPVLASNPRPPLPTPILGCFLPVNCVSFLLLFLVGDFLFASSFSFTMFLRSVSQAARTAAVRSNAVPMARFAAPAQVLQTRASSQHAIANPTLAGIEKRWESMPPQEQAELWMQLRDRMKVDWHEMTLQEKKAGTSHLGR